MSSCVDEDEIPVDGDEINDRLQLQVIFYSSVIVLPFPLSS